MMTARFITRQGGDDREARHLRGAAVGPSVRPSVHGAPEISEDRWC